MGIFNREHRTQYQDISKSYRLLASDDLAAAGNPFIAGRAKYSIFVQRIAVHVTTAAAQTITFRSSNGSPVILAVLPASAAVGSEHVLLEHEEGVQIAEGEDLDVVAAAAGVAGQISVLAFLKPTGTMVPSQV